MKAVELIGGPAHGKTYIVRDEDWEISFASINQPQALFYEEGAEKALEPVTHDVHTYTVRLTSTGEYVGIWNG
jgi:hypothetical protein